MEPDEADECISRETTDCRDRCARQSWSMFEQTITIDDAAEFEAAVALMLGARRAGVTNGLSDFQKRGILRVVRGSITIRNRVALVEAANRS